VRTGLGTGTPAWRAAALNLAFNLTSAFARRPQRTRAAVLRRPIASSEKVLLDRASEHFDLAQSIRSAILSFMAGCVSGPAAGRPIEASTTRIRRCHANRGKTCTVRATAPDARGSRVRSGRREFSGATMAPVTAGRCFVPTCAMDLALWARHMPWANQRPARLARLLRQRVRKAD
jgi:hypothetical protein